MSRPSLQVPRETKPAGQNDWPLVVFSQVWVAILQNWAEPHSSWRSQPDLQRCDAVASHHSKVPQPLTTQSRTHLPVVALKKKPASHLIPHVVPPSHVGWPFGVVGQGVQLVVPHDVGDVFDDHVPVHS